MKNYYIAFYYNDGNIGTRSAKAENADDFFNIEFTKIYDKLKKRLQVNLYPKEIYKFKEFGGDFFNSDYIEIDLRRFNERLKKMNSELKKTS